MRVILFILGLLFSADGLYFASTTSMGVGAAAELAAGVEDGVHHLQGGLAGLGLNVHGNAPAIVHHGDGAVLVDLHQDIRAVACQGLVDGVVHDLIHQMVKTGGGGGADIHTGPLADSLQPLQNLDLRGIIFMLRLGTHQNFVFSHVGSPFKGIFS